MEINTTIPMTLVCSKATEDIKALLEEVMREHGMSADLMCMILRDASSHFERMRANDYANAIIQQTAVIGQLAEENKALKKASDLFNMEGEDDNTGH